jgi:hypothetical protein
MLVLTAVCFLTTLAGAVVAARTPMPRRWLWAVGALVGFGRFTFNWTTGQVEQAMAWVQLFAVGVFRPGLAGPWLISVSCPALAVVALERARRFRQATERATASAIANVEGSPSDPPSGDQTRTGLAMGDHPPQRSSVEPAADLSADTPGTVSPS